MVTRSARRLDTTFAALSDPTRRAILERLARGEASVSELAAPFRISRPAVSKHLAVLDRSGLVSRQKRGREVRCRLQAAPLAEAEAWLERHRVFWDRQLDRLAAHFEQRPQEAIDP